MKTLLLIGSFFLSINFSFAQITETVRVNAGEDISKAISANGIYRLPSFVTGSCIMTDGGISPAKLNYNIALGEMQYINGRDTLAITNPEAFSFFKLGDVVFSSSGKGYKEIIKDYVVFRLAVGSEIKIVPEKVTAYGQPVGASNVTNLSSMEVGRTFGLKPRVNSIITKKTTYYILDKENSAEIASRKIILNMFDNKASVNNYLRTNPVNFNKVEDLKRLLDFAMEVK